MTNRVPIGARGFCVKYVILFRICHTFVKFVGKRSKTLYLFSKIKYNVQTDTIIKEKEK